MLEGLADQSPHGGSLLAELVGKDSDLSLLLTVLDVQEAPSSQKLLGRSVAGLLAGGGYLVERVHQVLPTGVVEHRGDHVLLLGGLPQGLFLGNSFFFDSDSLFFLLFLELFPENFATGSVDVETELAGSVDKARDGVVDLLDSFVRGHHLDIDNIEPLGVMIGEESTELRQVLGWLLLLLGGPLVGSPALDNGWVNFLQLFAAVVSLEEVCRLASGSHIILRRIFINNRENTYLGSCHLI